MPKSDSPLSFARIIAALAAAFFTASALATAISKESFTALTMIDQYSKGVFWAVLLAMLVLQVCLAHFMKNRNIIPIFLIGSSSLFALVLGCRSEIKVEFFAGLAFFCVITIFWAFSKMDRKPLELNIGAKATLIYTACLFLIYVIFVSGMTIVRHRAYGSSNFDMGIFTQMFEYMKKTGAPLTTVERNKLMSHFGVHFSPVFYLILPGYMIFSSPEYLLVMQAVAVAAGVFAIYAICRKLNVSTAETLLFSLLYLAYPTFSYSSTFDFHENAFLSVFVLWTLYFVIADKTVPLFIFALLTMSVKDDAAMYVIAIAIYMFASRRNKLKATLLMLFAVIYFAFGVAMVSHFGGESMFGRFDAYYPPNTTDKGVGQVIHTCFYDFGYFISQIFTEDKLKFIAWTCVPVLFLPLIPRKNNPVLFLLLPMLVVNLMLSWPYQYNIGYQYTFGSAALLVGATLITYADMNRTTRPKLLVTMVAISLVFVVPLCASKLKTYSARYESMRSQYDATEQIIEDTVPLDSTVTATTYIVPHMQKYLKLYMYPYEGSGSEPEIVTDYVVVDIRTSEYTAQTERLTDYELVNSGGIVEIYKLKNIQ